MKEQESHTEGKRFQRQADSRRGVETLRRGDAERNRNSTVKKVRAIVSGRVQGVCFRAYAQDKARELGVRGYVRNLWSGDVEIVAEGEDAAVDALMTWAWEGPPWAHVTGVDIEPLAPGEEFRGFDVRH